MQETHNKKDNEESCDMEVSQMTFLTDQKGMNIEASHAKESNSSLKEDILQDLLNIQ